MRSNEERVAHGSSAPSLSSVAQIPGESTTAGGSSSVEIMPLKKKPRPATIKRSPLSFHLQISNATAATSPGPTSCGLSSKAGAGNRHRLRDAALPGVLSNRRSPRHSQGLPNPGHESGVGVSRPADTDARGRLHGTKALVVNKPASRNALPSDVREAGRRNRAPGISATNSAEGEFLILIVIVPGADSALSVNEIRTG